MPSLRFADPLTLTQYPLEVSSTADWQPQAALPSDEADTGTGKAPVSRWQFSVDLGRLPKGEMIAPSLSLLDAPDHRYQFTLEADGKSFELAPIPPTAADKARRNQEPPRKARVRTAIDCFRYSANRTRWTPCWRHFYRHYVSEIPG